jgi:hypothetical protein
VRERRSVSRNFPNKSKPISPNAKVFTKEIHALQGLLIVSFKGLERRIRELTVQVEDEKRHTAAVEAQTKNFHETEVQLQETIKYEERRKERDE